MTVTRAQIITRGLTHCCPNCAAPTLFRRDSLFRINPRCDRCDFAFERQDDEGFFLGSMSLNYGVTIMGFLVPVMILAFFNVISVKAAIILASVGAVVFPALFYRSSRSWWLMNYYFFFPHHLPANGGDGRRGEGRGD
ncbi:MAG: hypothetical protein RL077_2984 [Verrucomicrobiota bacterium]